MTWDADRRLMSAVNKAGHLRSFLYASKNLRLSKTANSVKHCCLSFSAISHLDGSASALPVFLCGDEGNSVTSSASKRQTVSPVTKYIWGSNGLAGVSQGLRKLLLLYDAEYPAWKTTPDVFRATELCRFGRLFVRQKLFTIGSLAKTRQHAIIFPLSF